MVSLISMHITVHCEYLNISAIIIQNGYTDLMRASGGDSISIVRALLEAKADPNITTEVKLYYSHCLYQFDRFI